MITLDFVLTHLRVLALTLPWITAESDELANNEGEKKTFTTHISLFYLNSGLEQNEWTYGHRDDFDSRHAENALVIALLTLSFLISVFIYARGEKNLGSTEYTTLHLLHWAFDIAVLGVFYDLVDEALSHEIYDPISFGLFALIGCLLISTFHVARYAGRNWKLPILNKLDNIY